MALHDLFTGFTVGTLVGWAGRGLVPARQQPGRPGVPPAPLPDVAVRPQVRVVARAPFDWARSAPEVAR